MLNKISKKRPLSFTEWSQANFQPTSLLAARFFSKGHLDDCLVMEVWRWQSREEGGGVTE